MADEIEGPSRLHLDVHAHRGGAALAPENTLAAFRNALALGVDAMEMDLQVTRDGAVVVMHDDSVDRTTDGAGLVGDLTLEELRRFDAGGKFGPAYRGERIPTLQEVIDLVKASGNGRVRLNLEIKFRKGHPGEPSDFEERVLAILRGADFLDRVILQSFHHPSPAKVKALEPSIRTAVLVGGRQAPRDPVAVVRQAQADAYAPAFGLLTAEAVAALHQAGIPIVPWTVNEVPAMRQLIRLGIGRLPGDGIITDAPDRLLTLLKTHRERTP